MTTATDVKLEQLPVLPAVVVRLMSLSPGSDSYFEEVLRASSEDPALAIRVIHAANSALSAPRQPINTLEGALARLGATSIGNLVTAMAVTQVFVPRSRGEVDLWIHSVEVAAACELMVANAGVGVDHRHAYLCGLLHDIGRFVMFDQAPELLRAVDDGGWSSLNELVAAERKVFGYNHTDLGHQLCLKWSIPEPIATVVRDHHRTLELRPPVRPDEGLLAVVQMADRLSVLARAGALEAVADDVAALALLMAEACVDPAWPAPPIAPDTLARLVPEITRTAHLASEHLALRYA